MRATGWVAALAFLTLVGTVGETANAQTAARHSETTARTSWSPTRSTSRQSPHSDAAAQEEYLPLRDPEPTRELVQKRRVQPKSMSGRAVQQAGNQTGNRGRSAQRQSTNKRDSAVRQASHEIPSPPPIETIEYADTVVDGSCDAMGSCGCDAVGCDSMGTCEPSCGCSMCGELAGTRAWRPAVTLSLPQDGWVSIEAMHLWPDGMYLPPLVTASVPGTDRDEAGVLGRPGTRILYGGNEILKDAFDGGRLRFGFWLDRCHTVGIGAEYIEMDSQSESYSATSAGLPILARPFFNTETGRNDSELVAYPEVVAGTISVNAYSELAGGSIHVRRLRCCDEGCREWLFCGCKGHYCTRSEFRLGYRYLELNEGVSIREQLTATDGSGRFDIMDNFRTNNQFNGIDLAWNHRLVRGYWSCESLVRLGIGNTNQLVSINGTTTIIDRIDPSNPIREDFGEGILALDSNGGQHQNDQFSVLPEVNLILGYQLTERLKASIGYTAIYWSNVVRPGEHIPLQAGPSGFPPDLDEGTDPQPLFSFDTTDYWVQGITYGLEYRW